MKDRVILYTGAAGGLGLATTLLLMARGATVVAVDNDPVKGEQLRAAAGNVTEGTLILSSADLSDLSGFRAALDRIAAETGGFDIVINNAAIYPSKPFEDYSVEEHQAVQRVNVDAGIVAVQAALIGLTRAWAREFGGWGVTVNAIAPGAFPTDAEKIHPDPEGYNRMVLDAQAIKRRGTAEDIAHAIAFFAAEEAGFITGQTLHVNGGWVMA